MRREPHRTSSLVPPLRFRGPRLRRGRARGRAALSSLPQTLDPRCPSPQWVAAAGAQSHESDAFGPPAGTLTARLLRPLLPGDNGPRDGHQRDHSPRRAVYLRQGEDGAADAACRSVSEGKGETACRRLRQPVTDAIKFEWIRATGRTLPLLLTPHPSIRAPALGIVRSVPPPSTAAASQNPAEPSRFAAGSDGRQASLRTIDGQRPPKQFSPASRESPPRSLPEPSSSSKGGSQTPDEGRRKRRPSATKVSDPRINRGTALVAVRRGHAQIWPPSCGHKARVP